MVVNLAGARHRSRWICQIKERDIRQVEHMGAAILASRLSGTAPRVRIVANLQLLKGKVRVARDSSGTGWPVWKH
jgi:hypothetical protein